MVNRRTRLESKIARRQEWAKKADGRAAVAFEKTDKLASAIPLGQPILVGHHSERHARADAARIQNGMAKGVEEARLADYHERKADGLARQLDKSIFSDDDDALAALQARIDEREAHAKRMTAVNAAWRKSKGDVVAFATLVDPLGITPAEAQSIAWRIAEPHCYEKQPFASWETTNLRANIRRDKERIAEIQTRQARAAKAEVSDSGVMIENCPEGWCRVTFAEKPARSVLDALKAAGFHWGQGSWVGQRAKLPEGIGGTS